ncbi:MAG: MFS transporter [Candidatus Thorarchaeota archaeon]
MNWIKSNYLAYIVVYVFISLINMYLLLYFPLYFYDVFKVNRNMLALTQLIPNSMVILSVIFGYLFDRIFMKKKIIIYIACIILYCSFLLFILFKNIIFWFGFFLSIGLLARTIIQTGMSKLMFDMVKSNEKLKKNVVLIANASASVGSFIPTILFSAIVSDLYSITLWNRFFLVGWFISLPILLSFLLIKDSKEKSHQFSNVGDENYDSGDIVMNKSSTLILMISIFVSSFLFWSSILFGYPLSSWITNKFGELGFKWFSSLYFIYFLINTVGFFLAKHIHKNDNEKKIIIIGMLLVALLFLIFPVINFPLFVILYTVDSLIYGIVCSNFLYLIIDVSRKGKYENLNYQILQSASVIANIIFTPTGIILSSFFSTGLLMTISAFLVLIGIVSLIIDNIWKVYLK